MQVDGSIGAREGTVGRGFLEYVRHSYWGDLDGFRVAYQQAPPTSGEDRHSPSDDNTFKVCDADIHRLREAFIQVPLEDERYFAITLVLEAAMFAAVHRYDHENYARYVGALPLMVFVEAHHVGGIKRPHVLLAALESWQTADLKFIERGCEELLPMWATVYSETFKGRGQAVIRSLGADEDLTVNPYGLLPGGVMDALSSGLRRAVQRLE